MARKKSSSLVELTPIEYNRKERRYRVWQYERISSKLTAKKLKEICDKKRLFEEPLIKRNPDGSITYHYPRKPLLVIKDGRIHTTKYQLKKHSREECHHQATILLRLIKYSSYGDFLIGAKRTSIPYPKEK